MTSAPKNSLKIVHYTEKPIYTPKKTKEGGGFTPSPSLKMHDFYFLDAMSRSSIFIADSLMTVPGPKMATAPAS